MSKEKEEIILPLPYITLNDGTKIPIIGLGKEKISS